MPKTTYKEHPMTTMTFLAEHACLSSSINGAVDAFSIANIFWKILGGKGEEPLFQTHVVTVDGKPVTANGGLIVQPDHVMDDSHITDVIIIPAFFAPFSFDNDRGDAICGWLRAQHEKGTLIASTCTGSFLLARSGLLSGRLATTNWQFAHYFQKRYPDIHLRIDRIFTEDGGIYCTGAATAFMDLCLHFIEKFGSRDLARRCAKSLLIDPDRQEQTPYIVYDFWKKHSDTDVLKSQTWMEDNYALKLSIQGIAEKAGISPRHFIRRFKKATGEPPLAYLQLLRIENAKRRLETTRDSVNEITWKVGYEDINSFRRLFKKHTGMSPRDYRDKFSFQPRQSF